MDGEATRCQHEQPTERLALELKAIGQRNQHAELAEHEQIPAAGPCLSTGRGSAPARQSSVSVKSGPGIVRARPPIASMSS